LGGTPRHPGPPGKLSRAVTGEALVIGFWRLGRQNPLIKSVPDQSVAFACHAYPFTKKILIDKAFHIRIIFEMSLKNPGVTVVAPGLILSAG